MGETVKSERVTFFWRVIAAHTIAYFIAGIFALIFMNYREVYAGELMSLIMRPVDSPIVALGSGLQIFRGFIIALVLLPFREVFLSSKRGWLKLWGLIIGLSYISTIGPTFGSFDGYIFTVIPLEYHLLGIPETLIYTTLFSFMVVLWHKKPLKVWNVIAIILVVLIMLMSLMGFLSGIGIMPG
jgi:hypothetical protein